MKKMFMATFMLVMFGFSTANAMETVGNVVWTVDSLDLGAGMTASSLDLDVSTAKYFYVFNGSIKTAGQDGTLYCSGSGENKGDYVSAQLACANITLNLEIQLTDLSGQISALNYSLDHYDSGTLSLSGLY